MWRRRRAGWPRRIAGSTVGRGASRHGAPHPTASPASRTLTSAATSTSTTVPCASISTVSGRPASVKPAARTAPTSDGVGGSSRSSPFGTSGFRPSAAASTDTAAAEEVSDVARQRVHRTLVSIQRDRRVPAARVLDPEAGPEPPREISGPAAPPLGTGPAEGVEQGRAGQRSLMRVALDLAQRDGTNSECPVPPLHRVAGILPALIGQAAAGGVCVLQEPVAVGVSVIGHPGQSPFHGRQQGLDL